MRKKTFLGIETHFGEILDETILNIFYEGV